MVNTKQGKKDIDSYTIPSTNKLIRVGDCVLMRPPDAKELPYVARVEKMEANGCNKVMVHVHWYYRPEDTKGGRCQFHGAKELFLSNHTDQQSAHTINDKCIVHDFKNYTKLNNVGPEDFFCRFHYNATTDAFTPNQVTVYCLCEMPYNPDDLMIQCDVCKDWFHPSCVDITVKQAKTLQQFVCSNCLEEYADSFDTSLNSDLQSKSKRQRR